MLGISLVTGGLVGGIISIIAGILVLVWPRILAYVVGVFLIIMGILAILYVV